MHKVELRGELTSDMPDRLDLASLKQEGLYLIIDSQGGSEKYMQAIILKIESLQRESISVICKVVGDAFSAAILILQACRLRQAVPSARFMFHPPKIDPKIAGFIGFAGEKVALPTAPIYLELLKTLVRRNHLTISELDQWGRDERIFSAEEALELGFIDTILDPH